MPETIDGNEQPKKLSPAQKKGKKKTYIVLICVLAAIQVLLIVLCCTKPRPLDEILLYEVTAEVQEDGVMRTEYHIRWRVLDDSTEGPLTWVQIGMANHAFSVKDFSGNIRDADRFGSTYVKCVLDRTYYKGDTADFRFTVLQRSMLCRPEGGEYLYEFVPGWFPEIPVREYRFRWKAGERITSTNADRREDGMFVWSGSLKQDGYVRMEVRYAPDAFSEDAQLAPYAPFRKTGDGLSDRHIAKIMVCVFGILGLGLGQILFLNQIFVYSRGRGFIVVNHYHNTRGGGGGGHGGCACAGCACACACACAGGGRAGCSQKDFFRAPEEPKAEPPEEDEEEEAKGEEGAG